MVSYTVLTVRRDGGREGGRKKTREGGREGGRGPLTCSTEINSLRKPNFACPLK